MDSQSAIRVFATSTSREAALGRRDLSQPRTTALTLAEACAELRISRSTFYDWRAKHRASRCIKFPKGELRIRRTELDRWLDSREEAA